MRAWRMTNAVTRASEIAPRPSVFARAPAVLADADDRVHAEHQSDRAQHGARDVGAGGQAEARLRGHEAQGEHRGGDPDRDVDEEDPVPGDGLGQRAAGQQADRPARGGDEAVDADRLGLLARLGEHRHDHPEHDGRCGRAAGALHEAGDDQHLLRLRDGAQQRCTREDGETAEEHLALPDQIAEAARQQQQPAEGDQVGVDDPCEAALGETEFVLDRRQCDVHDRRVEHDHEHAGTQRVERQPARPVGCLFGHGHRFSLGRGHRFGYRIT